MKSIECLPIFFVIACLQLTKGAKNKQSGRFVLTTQSFTQYGVLESLQVHSEAMCFARCMNVPECVAVNFDQQSKQCELLEPPMGKTLLHSSPVSAKSSGDWVSYELQDRHPGCRAPWQYVSGSCVRLETRGVTLTWTSASIDCGSRPGGSILTLRNVPAEVPVKVIGAFGTTCGSTFNPNISKTFLGGLRQTVKSQWEWEDGSIITHVPWASPPPYWPNTNCLWLLVNSAPIGSNVYNEICNNNVEVKCYMCETQPE